MPAADQEIGPGYLAAVLEALTPGVIAVDEDFTVTWRNRAAEEMVPEARPGISLYDALTPFAHQQKIDRLTLRREIITVSYGPERPNIDWLHSRRPLEGGGYVFTTWHSNWTDNMNDRRVDFTMAASHELRTPLTVLLGFAELLLIDTSRLSPSQVEAAGIIEQTARHLRSLVDDIFDLTRNSFGELRLTLKETDMARLTESVAETLRPQIEERAQTLDVRIEGGIPLIDADSARIRQVISNLIGNASVHNGPGTAIEVDLRHVDGELLLSIADDGAGIGFDEPEDAFHSFIRGEEAIEGDRAGSGIGLPVAKRLVELHRGRITVDSRPGRGTRFEIRLPLDRDSALAPGEPGPA
ncbi:MAG: PAS domain-containing sensor histidine kinase [Actinomycetota bacterium]|nr:PAS domain-containing sensor histidine kinase [Actinomycetota bacterium]